MEEEKVEKEKKRLNSKSLESLCQSLMKSFLKPTCIGIDWSTWSCRHSLRPTESESLERRPGI